MKKIFYKGSVLVFALLFALNANAFSFELPNPGITPESPFYFMDKALERVGNFFTFGAENKARRKLSISEERLAELKELTEDGSEKMDEAFSNYEKEIEGLFSSDNFKADLLERIASSTAGHRFALEDIEDFSFEKQDNEMFSKIQKRIQKTKEKALEIHKRYVGKLSKKDPEKAVKVFSNTVKNRLKNLEKKAEVETEKGAQRVRKMIQENEEYANFGKEISEIVKGLRKGGISVEELVEKVTSHSGDVLERARERIEERTGKSFGEVERWRKRIENETPNGDSKGNEKKSSPESPKESYLKMREEFKELENFEEFKNYTYKYGSKESISNFEEKEKEINALPDSFKDQVFELARSTAKSEIDNIEENINGKNAILLIKASNPSMSGTVEMILENGQWKLTSESWK